SPDAWGVTETPPWRSRPRRGAFPAARVPPIARRATVTMKAIERLPCLRTGAVTRLRKEPLLLGICRRSPPGESDGHRAVRLRGGCARCGSYVKVVAHPCDGDTAHAGR